MTAAAISLRRLLPDDVAIYREIRLEALRDSPDAFVVSSTILVLVAPAGALVYSFMRRPNAAVR